VKERGRKKERTSSFDALRGWGGQGVRVTVIKVKR
jgi:hypothetical protein